MDDEPSVPAVEAVLEGNKLTVTTKAIGHHTIGLAVESNGKTASLAVNVEVKDKGSMIQEAEGAVKRIFARGRDITVKGYAGCSFELVNPLGAVAEAFSVDSDSYVYHVSSVPGVYILIDNTGSAKKIIIK